MFSIGFEDRAQLGSCRVQFKSVEHILEDTFWFIISEFFRGPLDTHQNFDVRPHRQHILLLFRDGDHDLLNILVIDIRGNQCSTDIGLINQVLILIVGIHQKFDLESIVIIQRVKVKVIVALKVWVLLQF